MEESMRALFITNEKDFSNEVLKEVRKQGFIVDQIENDIDDIRLVTHFKYDIIILDTDNGEDYHAIIKKIRYASLDTPLIVLSPIPRTQAKIKAFDYGADDFVVKPFDTSELIARIKAIIRRSNGFSHRTISCGDISIDTTNRTVYVNGQEIHMTNKEYAILELLVMKRDTLITKETFLNHLYGGLDEPEVKIIDVFICKLRKKLASFGAKQSIITVWGKGYMMKSEPSPAALPSSLRPMPTHGRFEDQNMGQAALTNA
jgi:two-component system cell cycle response regulator CtrA